jgi:aminoglycoside phosphotransferase (APT) family kinase protein
MPDSKPHGFDDDDDTRTLLRSRPPAAALAWVASALGGPVDRVRVLRGGMSSAIHQVSVGATRAVLRRYVRPDTEPDIAGREARALAFVAALPLPTPALLAADLTGAATGVPMLLMSRLPGRVDWRPSDPDGWLLRMAELLPVIHAVPLPAPGVIAPFATYRQRSYALPPWARWPAVWERTLALVRDPPPCHDPVFLHRDFHPGNVLWRRGRVTGVVDWQSASIGPAGVDVGHCRLNLLSYGRDVVDRFTQHWERISGRRYDPWADLSTIIGWLDDVVDRSPSDGYPVEDLLAAAVAELG